MWFQVRGIFKVYFTFLMSLVSETALQHRYYVYFHYTYGKLELQKILATTKNLNPNVLFKNLCYYSMYYTAFFLCIQILSLFHVSTSMLKFTEVYYKVFTYTFASNYIHGLPCGSVKRLSTVRETRVQSLGWEDPLEREMAIHSSTNT